MKLNQLIGMSQLPTHSYEFGGKAYSTQELWCKISEKINIIIEHFNYLESKVQSSEQVQQEKLDYLLNEGLNLEMSKVVLEKIKDGTIGTLINEELLGDINTKLDNEVSKINSQLTDIVKLPNGDDLNTILNSLPDGTTFKLPSGTYETDFIKLENKENLIIYGDFFNTKIKFKSLISPLSANGYYENSSDFIHVLIHNCKNIVFKDLAIEGLYDGVTTSEKYSHGIVTSGTSDNIQFNNILLGNCIGEGILHNSIGVLKIENCKLNTIRNSAIGSSNVGKVIAKKNTIDNIAIQSGVSAISWNSEFEFEGNTINGIVQTGVKVGHPNKKASGYFKDNILKSKTNQTINNCFSLEELSNITIEGNSIEGFRSSINGASLTTTDCKIRFNKNNIKNMSDIAIGSFINLSNMEIMNNIIDTAKFGIYLNSSNKNITIKGNKIFNVTEDAIRLHSSNNINNIIDENIIDGCKHGIYIEGSSFLNYIGDKNIIKNANVKDCFVQTSNTYSNKLGNINKFKFNSIPILNGDGTSSDQSPSTNDGDLYLTPSVAYTMFRFDNGYCGQEIKIIGTNNLTTIKVRKSNYNASNIYSTDEIDITVQPNKIYTFLCISDNSVDSSNNVIVNNRVWKLVSIT